MLLLVALGGFAAGRWLLIGGAAASPGAQAGARTAPGMSNAAAAWNNAFLGQLDRALEADQAGDVENALLISNTLLNKAGPLSGLQTYIEVLRARAQGTDGPLLALARLPAASTLANADSAAAVHRGLGFVYARQRKFQLASEQFRRAALAEPFSAENFRLLGESLRRQGKLGEAVAAFREALARYPVGAVEFMDLRAQAEYKIRLSQAESGASMPDSASDLQVAPNLAGYRVLADAAAALQQGDLARAAQKLERARPMFSPDQWDLLLSDYFFRAYAGQTGMAAFFAADPAALARGLKSRQVYFIDP